MSTPFAQFAKLNALTSVVLLIPASALSSSDTVPKGASSAQQIASQYVSGRYFETPVPVFDTWVEQRDRGVVKQSLDYSCGIAALATLLKMSFDIEVSEATLLALLEERASQWQLGADWAQRGVSMKILSQMAAHYELSAVGVSVSAMGLMRLQKPAIALIAFQGLPHFTVIKPPLADNEIELADPTWGNRTLTRWQFLPLFLSGDFGKLLLVN